MIIILNPFQVSVGGGGRGGVEGEGGGVGAEKDQEEGEGRHVQVPDNSPNLVPNNSPPEFGKKMLTKALQGENEQGKGLQQWLHQVALRSTDLRGLNLE